MIVPDQRLPIVIATKPVDFRRGHDGLAATVSERARARPAFGADGGVPIEARRQAEDPGVGR
jgi:hypothetical protein